ncbi:MAG: membrane protein insertase YidC, partial [Woeseiales bacterium]
MPIEQLRSMLLIGLMMVGFLLWQAWQEDYAPSPTSSPSSISTISSAVPDNSKADVPRTPTQTASGSAGSTDIPLLPGQAVTARVSSESGEVVRVRTDLLDVVIDTIGGTLREVRLRAFDATTENKEEAFVLITPELPEVFLVQSGLIGHQQAPTHRSPFKAQKKNFELNAGETEISVPMSFRVDNGFEVTKRFIFKRDSYVVRIEHDIRNTSSEALSMRMYSQLHRAEVEQEGGLFRTYTYTGGVISQPEKPYQKIDFGDMAEQNLDATYRGGWIAMIQHYFAAAVIPPIDQDNYYYTLSPGGERFVVGAMDAGKSIAVGQSVTLAMNVY